MAKSQIVILFITIADEVSKFETQTERLLYKARLKLTKQGKHFRIKVKRQRKIALFFLGKYSSEWLLHFASVLTYLL